MAQHWWTKRLPLIDGLAALTAGLVILALRDPLSEIYKLPVSLLTTTGAVNVLYSAGGLSFTARRSKPQALLFAVIVANLFWTCVCLALAIRFRSTASFWGVGHFVGEGAFVAALAALEWKNRHIILGSGKKSE